MENNFRLHACHLMGSLGAILAGIGAAKPSLDFINSVISQLSNYLGVDDSAIIFGFLLSIYLTATVRLSLHPEFRKQFRLAFNSLLRSEKSFYSSGPNALGVPSAPPNFTRSALKKLTMLHEEKIHKLESEIQNLSGLNLDENDLAGAQSKILDAAIELSSETSEEVKWKLARDKMSYLEDASLSRLSDQIVVLGKRANLALASGIGFCLSGLFILWWTLSGSQPAEFADVPASVYWGDFAKTYAPRLSLVLIIEIIGFFFLKLFRGTLDEVRSTQNEITNVEMKLISAHLALSECREELSHVIQNLVSTERNVIIEKGQTTAEIEREKGIRDMEGKYVGALLSLLRSKK